jgi:hypothetical protein
LDALVLVLWVVYDFFYACLVLRFGKLLGELLVGYFIMPILIKSNLTKHRHAKYP